ncbi:MAG: 50S ribosomal protein L9 [Pseudomonadota bacterium]
MQVILKEDVVSLGRGGDLVWVKPGYGRNYLIPQGLAVLATSKNVDKLEHDKKVIESKMAKLRKDAESIAQRLGNTTVQIARQVGDGEKLFGSVTTRDLAEALAEKGIQIDHKKIHLAEPFRALGRYSVEVKLGRNVTGKFNVTIVAQDA